MNLLSNLLQTEQQEQPPPKQRSSDFFFCFHAKDYFNIQEENIFDRIKSAVLLKPAFSQVLNNKPDLYGPFWIATTLIVVIIAASSLLQFFENSNSSYNFNQLTVATTLIYGIAFGSPYIIAIMVKIFGGMTSVVDLICIYGYSLTSFLPVTALCFINSKMIQTVLLFLAFAMSTVFLVRGILSLDSSLGQKERGVITVFIVGVQIILVFMYKFYFFDLL